MENMAPDKMIKTTRDTGTIKSDKAPDSTRIGGLALVPFILTFIIMLGFWLVFSGKFDFFHMGLGVISSLIVAGLSSDLLFPEAKMPGFLSRAWRFSCYLPWLLYQVFLANLHVLYLVFHPGMKELIEPRLIEFKSKLESEISRTTFANSITLTPGTITVHVGAMGNFMVHCIDGKSAQSLPGDMEERIFNVFYG